MTQRPLTRLNGGFVHLHVHSEFSLQDALSRIEAMIQPAWASIDPAGG